MGFVADFSANNFQPKPAASSHGSLKSARGYLADFGIELPPEPKETFQRSNRPANPTPESQLRQAAIRSGKSSGFRSFTTPQTSNAPENQEKTQLRDKLKNQLKQLKDQLETVVKAGYVANLTEEKLRDEIGRAKDKLANRSEQLKQKSKEKEDADKKLKATKKLADILEARVFGPGSRANDWKWGLDASLMNDCLDIKLGFRLDEELDESQQYRLFNFLHEQKDKVWSLRDQASNKKDEVARVQAEVKVLEKTLSLLQEKHKETAASKDALERKRDSLRKQKDQLQDKLFRLTGSFS